MPPKAEEKEGSQIKIKGLMQVQVSLFCCLVVVGIFPFVAIFPTEAADLLLLAAKNCLK
jgi:hypothetical protein